jgi:hypothetical protein
MQLLACCRCWWVCAVPGTCVKPGNQHVYC